jgi:hypothetical protein
VPVHPLQQDHPAPMEHRMHILFPTAMLMAQAGLIAGMTASLA